jgi:transposase
MDDYHLSTKKISELKETHRSLKTKWEADRVKAVILLGSGWMPSQVGGVLLLDSQTVRSYFLKYREGGVEKLLESNYTGRDSFLTETQEKELTAHLEKYLYLSSKDVRQYILKKYRINYSLTGIKHLLHRLGFTYKKPKHVPGKANKKDQKEWEAKYKKRRKNAGKNEKFYFIDGVHPRHNSIPAYGWIKVGEEKEIPANCGRQGVNINGAVNIDTMDIITDFTDSVNGQSTIRLLEKILKHHPNAKVIHIFLDNAGYYRSKIVKEWLKDKPILLHYLPPYSPNLNLIERVWKFFKEKVMYNKYYEKFSDFVASVKSFFRCRKRYKEELRSRLAENFHI